MNRLDKVVVFKPLGENELRKVLDIELNALQQRVFCSSQDRCFVFNVTEPAKDFLLAEGTDTKYGARHLKRAIERLVVQPMSNLIATEQVRSGDLLRVDFDEESRDLHFMRDAEGLAVQAMAEMIEIPVRSWMRASAAAQEAPKVPAARGSRRG